MRAARRAGYDTRTRAARAGDRASFFFHAERARSPAADRSSTPRGRRRSSTRTRRAVRSSSSARCGARATARLGPTPAGPILRWHSHVVCKEGTKRGLKPLAEREVPTGCAAHAGRERDAPRLVHGRPSQRVRDHAPRGPSCARGFRAAASIVPLSSQPPRYSSRSRGVSSRRVAARRISASRTRSSTRPQMLAPVHAHRAVFAAGDDRTTSRVEGRRPSPTRRAPEDDERSSPSTTSQTFARMRPGHEPAPVGAEGAVVDLAVVL